MAADEKLKLIKADVNCLLTTFPEGATLAEFMREFRGHLNYQLPYAEFGYSNTLQFLESMTDAVSTRINKEGKTVLQAIASSSNFHILKLVHKQRTQKNRRDNRPHRNHFGSRFSSKPTTVDSYSVKSQPQVTAQSSHNPVNSRPRFTPFIPALLRGEILHLMKNFPDGIGYASMAAAYQDLYGKPLNLKFLSDDYERQFQRLVLVVQELRIRVVLGQKKIFCDPSAVDNDQPLANMLGLAADSNANGSSFSSDGSIPDETAKQEVYEQALEESIIPLQIKLNCEKVLQFRPEGVLATHFPFVYKDVVGEEFDFQGLGYKTLLDFVAVVPNIFYYTQLSGSTSAYVLLPANSKEALLAKSKDRSSQKQRFDEPNGVCEPATDQVSSDFSLPPPELHEDSSGQLHAVFVSAIASINRFWFTLEESRNKFEAFENALQKFYNGPSARNYLMDAKEVLLNRVCVACCNDYWYRSMISSFKGNSVQVYFADYGQYETIPQSSLRHLKQDFAELPCQAFPAKLASVKPLNEEKEFSPVAKCRFNELCNSLSNRVRIVSKHQNVYIVQLYQSELNEEVGAILVRERLVQHCSSSNFDRNVASPSQKESHCNGHDNYKSSSSNTKESAREISHGAQSPERLSNGDVKIIRKYVKWVDLGDSYSIHMIKIDSKAFVTSQELCHLLWPDREEKHLTQNLACKKLTVPTRRLFKDSYSALFQQCMECHVKGFSIRVDSVVLFPFTSVMKILNAFGHTSAVVRESICREIEKFNPRDSFWDENDYLHCKINETPAKAVFSRTCSFNLLIEREKFVINAAILQDNGKEGTIEMQRYLQAIKKCEQRIKEVQEICDKFPCFHLEDS